MLVKTDFHLHTRYIGCADETMEVVDILRICQDAGLEEIAITDHLNHLGQLDQHWQIKEALVRCDESITVYFGAELSFSGPNGQLAIDDEAFENAIGFQFFIGGIHSSEEAVLKLMYLATQDTERRWTKVIPNWGTIYSQLTVYFGDRVTKYS